MNLCTNPNRIPAIHIDSERKLLGIYLSSVVAASICINWKTWKSNQERAGESVDARIELTSRVVSITWWSEGFQLIDC